MRARYLVSMILLFPTMSFMISTAEASPSIEDLSWMVGSWSGDVDGMLLEEHWIEPKGGMMLGLHRDLADGKTVMFEYLRIEETPDGLVYMASPRGKPAVGFRLTSLEGRRAVFENPDHDYPQRILYWLAEDGALHARIEGPRDGVTASSEWRWTPSSR